ncbi:hypothetical protein [Lysobacter firmicutimachus]|uniref:Lipoprotein n=1 Tax=Lysobacter firmicutimachus TaxID=1792846 RepID=A0ABU8D1B3_9GAMM
MRTEIALWAAGALALAAGCSRLGADAGAGCQTPPRIEAGHAGGWCGLPHELREFVIAHEHNLDFSGGEPSDAQAMEALSREAEQRRRDERARWDALRAEYRSDPSVAAWMTRYGRSQEWP